MPAIHEVKGYAIVLDKVVHITRIFEAGDAGVQFNIRMLGDTLLKLKFPDLPAATLARTQLLEAIKSA